LLVSQCLLEVDVRSLRKSHKSLKRKENNLKIMKAWTMCLRNMEKQNQREQCAWKMKTLKKQNKTLKVLNGIGIEFFRKSQFDFNFQLVLELNPKFGFDFFLIIDLGGQFPPNFNNWILNIQFQVHLIPKT